MKILTNHYGYITLRLYCVRVIRCETSPVLALWEAIKSLHTDGQQFKLFSPHNLTLQILARMTAIN